MTKLYEFNANFGRMGSLHGRFLLDEEREAKLPEIYGKTIHFGEVLRKHSDVSFVLRPSTWRWSRTIKSSLGGPRPSGSPLSRDSTPSNNTLNRSKTKSTTVRQGKAKWDAGTSSRSNKP